MKKYWWQSGIFAFISNSSTMIFGFFTFLLLVRVLSKEEFGAWVLYLTVITFAEIARNGITQNGLVKFAAPAEDQEYKKIVSAAFILNFLAGVGGFLILNSLAFLFIRLWNTPVLSDLLLFYGVYLVFYIPLIFIQFLAMAKMDFKTRFYSNISYNAGFFIIVLVYFLTLNHINIKILPLLQALAAFIALLITIISGKNYIKIDFRIDWNWVSKLFHFGKYVMGTNFSSMLFNRMDLMMVGYFMNPQSVAVYNVPTRIGNYVEVPMNTIASIVFPKTAVRHEEQGNDAIRYLYERAVGAMLAIIIPMALFLLIFAEPVVLLIAGEKYLDSVPVLRILILVSLVKPFGRQGGTTLDAIGEPKKNFHTLLASLIINFVLNWLFIINYGLQGAAFATLLSFIIGTTMQQVILVKILKIKIYHPFIYMKAFYRDGFKKILAFVRKI